jgi:hypothetical protein
MLTTLQEKYTVISYACQEYTPSFVSLSKSVYQFFTNHGLTLFRTQKSTPKQINRSELSTANNSHLLQFRKMGIPNPSEPQTEIKDCFIRVYIPSRDFRGEIINNTEMIQKMSELFAQLFGGCTRFPAKGVWLSKSGQIIEEDITLIESYAAKVGFEECLKVVRVTILDFKSKYQQESMAVNINDRLYLF